MLLHLVLGEKAHTFEDLLSDVHGVDEHDGLEVRVDSVCIWGVGPSDVVIYVKRPGGWSDVDVGHNDRGG